MNHLLRELAPITASVWTQLDDEARSRLKPALNGRALVDFIGPLGWEHSATSLGRVSGSIDAPTAGVSATRRSVLPVVELRVDFTLSRAELEAADRGALDVDLSALDRAALELAVGENSAIFNGWDAAGFTGIRAASAANPVRDQDSPSELARAVAAAVARLNSAGVGGPYGLAVDTDAWVNVQGGNDAGGSPLAYHVRSILDGPVLWVPGIDTPTVVSLRGGDFVFECGEDIALGYADHTAADVTLYLQESFTFRVNTPEAAAVIE